MSVNVSATDEQTSLQARIVVSLSYVQALRREIEAGRVSMTMLDDYLERLEGHLRMVESSQAIATDAISSGSVDATTIVGDDDMLISEYAARP